MVSSGLLKEVFEGSHSISEKMLEIDSSNGINIKDLGAPEIKD
jgi:hypothetical protein